MPGPVFDPVTETPVGRHAAPAAWRLVPVVTVAAIVVMVGAAILLWAGYGTAVFFETIRAGFSACFG